MLQGEGERRGSWEQNECDMYGEAEFFKKSHFAGDVSFEWTLDKFKFRNDA